MREATISPFPDGWKRLESSHCCPQESLYTLRRSLPGAWLVRHLLPSTSPGFSPWNHLLSLGHHLLRNNIKGLCVHNPKLALYEKDNGIWALCRQICFAASLLPLCSQVDNTFLSQDMYGGAGDIKELEWKTKALPTLCANPAVGSWRKWKFLSLGKTLRLH